MNEKIKIGKSGIEVNRIGLGCWAIGGQFTLFGKPDGYGEADDVESVRAIIKAVDLGVNFFDTADVYGTGHSEKVLGRALKGMRNDVVIATKFGFTADTEKKDINGENTAPEYIRKACEASLKRLDTEWIDLYLMHPWSVDEEKLPEIADTLENLRQEGKIREYGWSTGDVAGIDGLAGVSQMAAVMHPMNVLGYDTEVLKACDRHSLVSLASMPLAMGLLSGKYGKNHSLPSQEVRGSDHGWVSYFKNGKPEENFLADMNSIKEILMGSGRSLVQGALAWILAEHENTVAVPGFKNSRQAEENARTMEFGPLNKSEMEQIHEIIKK